MNQSETLTACTSCLLCGPPLHRGDSWGPLTAIFHNAQLLANQNKQWPGTNGPAPRYHVWVPRRCGHTTKMEQRRCVRRKCGALERQADAVGGEVVGPRVGQVGLEGLQGRLACGCVLADEANESHLHAESGLRTRAWAQQHPLPGHVMWAYNQAETMV